MAQAKGLSLHDVCTRNSINEGTASYWYQKKNIDEGIQNVAFDTKHTYISPREEDMLIEFAKEPSNIVYTTMEADKLMNWAIGTTTELVRSRSIKGIKLVMMFYIGVEEINSLSRLKSTYDVIMETGLPREAIEVYCAIGAIKPCIRLSRISFYDQKMVNRLKFIADGKHSSVPALCSMFQLRDRTDMSAQVVRDAARSLGIEPFFVYGTSKEFGEPLYKKEDAERIYDCIKYKPKDRTYSSDDANATKVNFGHMKSNTQAMMEALG